MSTEAQQIKNYEAAWKKVEELVSVKNLPKSALAEVKNIYTLAKKEKQDAQIIKSLLYITSLQQETREENEIFSVKEIETEIASAKDPAKAILQNILAGMYWNYFQGNRWQIYNRTETADFKKEDIATWSTGDFHKKITDLYLQSLSNDKLLKQTKLENFDAIITKGNVRHLRPTLYDLLANSALEYFKNDEKDIAKPAYAFEIDNENAFAPAGDFINEKFITKDSASLQHKALVIYQDLLKFHLKDEKPDALIDADIARIQFVKEHSIHPDKDELYRKALTHIVNQYKNIPAAAQASYLLASEYNNDADNYKPYGDTTNRYARKKAEEIANEVLLQKDSSEGKINAYNILKEINKQSLSFSVEKVNIPNQSFRALVEYRNIEKLYFRIIQPDATTKKLMEEYYNEALWKQLAKLPSVKSWEQNLPATNDVQTHKTEIAVDALPVGEYILLASTENNFDNKASLLGARLFFVSNISYVNQQNEFFVLHRETGKPLTNAGVQVWEQVYDYKTYKYSTVKGKKYTTDKNGYFILENNEAENSRRGRENYKLDISWNNDKLFMTEWEYSYYYSNNAAPENEDIINNRRLFFFTDRSIYRPGQTVYFKAITVVPDKKEKNKVLSDFKTTIILRDANYQKVDSLKLTTNEYGSVSGKFQLPQGVLNGQFSIYEENNKGTVFFSVEEYKRPKFYVEYENIKGTFKVNDTIKVTGNAKAYAGNNIDGALVKYRVVRQPRFIYPWLYRRWWLPAVAPLEIKHGEITTDADGKFKIEFEAIPDKSIDKKLEPVFDYTVYADVTDINGETRSGETSVSVSYKELMLSVNIGDKIPADSLKMLSIRSSNMSGEFEPAPVTVTISKLKEEKRLIRQRYWERPDQFVMTKESYISKFPHDEYDNETDMESWLVEAISYTKTDSTQTNSLFTIGNSRFAIGFYQIEVTAKDKNGETVKDIKYVELYDEKSKQLNHPEYLWTEASSAIEPGEKTTIKLGSSANDLHIIQQNGRKIQVPVKYETYQYISLNNEKKSFEFTATENDRGGYSMGYFFIKDNRLYQYSDFITIPWSNKDLKIEYATFRDKTLPGSEEKWKIKITGYKNEKVAAEMLASMYDASLDQFKPHNWNLPQLWPNNYSSMEWNGTQNFLNVEAQIKEKEDGDEKYVQKDYDVLMNTANSFGSGWYRMGNIASPMKMAAPAMSATSPEGELNEVVVVGYGSKKKEDIAGSVNDQQDEMFVEGDEQKKSPTQQSVDIQIRKNFNETAFFFPDLRTDSDGAIEFSFTIPEALTKWKIQTLAHTKDLAMGLSTREMITQKELMVQPNAPRFLREGDKMEFSSKIVNLTGKEITGQASLQLFDATTNESVDGWFQNMIANQFFTIAAGQSEAVKFPIEVPYLFNKALTWRIVAKSEALSDGEEASLPVLTNRMLVTESLPLNMRGAGTKTFKFEKLLNSSPAGGREGASETLQHHAVTVEYTSNPVWYAVQALPYLMEYPYECAEQTWNRYYANALASHITNSSPRIKEVFKKWEESSKIPPSGGGGALLSALQKNEELKSVLLEETPWVLQAKSEEEQKKNIALLFDMIRMSNEMNSAYEKLKQMQSPNGGFVWFKGGPDNRYITQYIITGIGHLYKLNAIPKEQKAKLDIIVRPALAYLDKKIDEDYKQLLKLSKDKKSPFRGDLGGAEIQYLYMRSFFNDIAVAKASQTAYNYFRSRAMKTWVTQSKYMQGMIALSLFRSNEKTVPAAILKSLKETSINNEELGMYWKDLQSGWYWYQAPIETQALLIEAFAEAGKDTKTVDDLKTWLLKNKQTNNWKTTKATAEACYAMLLQGTDLLSNENKVEIKLGSLTISSGSSKAAPSGGGLEGASEAGTGYLKQTISGEKVNSEMGNISLIIESSKASPSGGGLEGAGASWGAVYWQYFENLDKITTASTPLQLVKKLFVETNTDKGPVLTPVNENGQIKVGDKIKVRIELRVDRDMEYVHMKDMRASCMEPVNVLSGYKWQGGLGYYETTKDASTNFFFDYLRKGTYVFEYPLFVTHSGEFSNGVTTIQCMYAPEFTSHSEGIRVNVE